MWKTRSTSRNHRASTLFFIFLYSHLILFVPFVFQKCLLFAYCLNYCSHIGDCLSVHWTMFKFEASNWRVQCSFYSNWLSKSIWIQIWWFWLQISECESIHFGNEKIASTEWPGEWFRMNHLKSVKNTKEPKYDVHCHKAIELFWFLRQPSVSSLLIFFIWLWNTICLVICHQN